MKQKCTLIGVAGLLGIGLSMFALDYASAQLANAAKGLQIENSFVQKAHQCHSYCDHGHKHGASPFCERITCVIGRAKVKAPKTRSRPPE